MSEARWCLVAAAVQVVCGALCVAALAFATGARPGLWFGLGANAIGALHSLGDFYHYRAHCSAAEIARRYSRRPSEDSK